MKTSFGVFSGLALSALSADSAIRLHYIYITLREFSVPSITLASGTRFDGASDLSLLDAGLQAGVSLPYSCKTGRCSTCRCRIIVGETRALQPETGLTSEERATGWVLGCVRAPITDVTTDLVELADIDLPPVRTIPCRVDRIERLSPDVVRIMLRFPPSANFRYLPGQYVQMIGPCGIRRSYSIANVARNGIGLELQIRAVAGGAMSHYWFEQVKTNDLLRLCGPFGTFILGDVAGMDVVFLATGTGIAPVKAILESLPDRAPDERPRSITVYWGGRTPEDLYLDVASWPGHHRFIPALSRADAIWEGERGYVQDAFRRHPTDIDNTVVYACGSDAMIHGARKALWEWGLPDSRFHSDAFVCSAVS